MKCPNINNKNVKAAFNDCVTALGGKPLSLSEFRSYELQSKRVGVDKVAVYSTYRLFDTVDDEANFVDRILSFNGDSKKILPVINELLQRRDSVYSVNLQLASPVVSPPSPGDHDAKSSLLYIAQLMRVSGYDEWIDLAKKIEADIDSDSDLKSELNEIMANSLTELENILAIINRTYSHTVKLSLGELMSANNPFDSSIWSIIDKSVSFNKILEYTNNEISIFSLIDKEKRSQFFKETLAYINDGYIDIESEFASIILDSAHILADDINSTVTDDNPISSADGMIEGFHYTIDNGIVTVSSVQAIKDVLNSSVSSVVTFNLSGFDRSDFIGVAKEAGYSVSFSEIGSTVTIFKNTKSISAFFSQNRGNLERINKFITDYYADTHAKTRSNLPSAVAHISRSVLDSAIIMEDCMKILKEISKEAESIIKRSTKRTVDPISKKHIVSRIEIADGFESIKNSVYIHQLDVDLLPLAEAILSLLAKDVADSNNSELISLYSKYKNSIDTSRADLNAISELNYNNILTVLARDYNVDIDAVNIMSETNRSSSNKFFYLFKYLNKSNVPELKYISFVLNQIGTEATGNYRSNSKLKRITELGKKLSKKSKDNYFKKFKPYNFYGKNKKGVPSGYLKARVRWGDYFEEYARFEEMLFEEFGAKGLYDYSVSSELLPRYKEVVNDWVSENTCMPAGPKYFNAIKSLSADTYAIYSEHKKNVEKKFRVLTHDDFIYNTERMQEFNAAYADLAHMQSPLDLDGNPKEPGTDAYRMYSELRKYSEEMKDPNVYFQESKFFEELMAKALKKLSAVEYSKFVSKYSAMPPKERGVKSASQTEDLFYNYKMAIRPYEHLIHDVAFILKNENLIKNLTKLYSESASESTLVTHPGPVFTWLRNEIADKYGENAVSILYHNGMPNPIFFTGIKSDKIPSYIFSFSQDYQSTFSNPDYLPEFKKYDMYPNLEKYRDDEYFKLSDDEKEFIETVEDLLLEINRNNGTVSMYGPVIPQVSVGFWEYVFKVGLLKAFKYYAFNRDEDITTISGFGDVGRVPVALFSKYTSMLNDKKAIDRDLFRILALALKESLVNKSGNKHLYSLHTILGRLKRKNYESDYEIGKLRMYSEFGIDVNGTELQKKGQFNFGMLVKNLLVPAVRAVQLGFHLIGFAGNALATDATLRSDLRFYRIKDIVGSMGFVRAHVARAINRKLKFGDVKEDKLSTMVKALNIKGYRAENEHRHLYGSSFAKSFVSNFLYFGYSASESMAMLPIVMGVTKNIRFVPAGYTINGLIIPSGFYNKQQFLQVASIQGREKETLRRFYSIKNTLYNAFVYSETANAWILDTNKYEEVDLVSAMAMASDICNELISNATGKFNASYSGVSASLAAIMAQNRQYVFNILNVMFTSPTYDIGFKARTEGILYSLYEGAKRLSLKYIKAANRADRQELTFYQKENIRLIGNLVINYLVLSYIAVQIGLLVNSGELFFPEDDEEDEITIMDRAKRNLLAFITASFARGAQEASAMIFLAETILTLAREPASIGHANMIGEIVRETVDYVFEVEKENPPTSKEIYDELYGAEFESEVEDMDSYGRPIERKEPESRYRKEINYTLHDVANVFIPGYRGVHTSFIAPEERANIQLKRLLPVNIFLLLTDYERKLKWDKEYEKNAERALKRYLKRYEIE